MDEIQWERALDPNRALTFLLDAEAAGLLDKDYIRRNLTED